MERRAGGESVRPPSARSPRVIVQAPRFGVRAPRASGYRYYSRWYPRPYYGYGVGAALGYGFYYDPFDTYPRRYYSGGYVGGSYDYDMGELRLRVTPRDAEVWIDGYYAGMVDDFDGTFQRLRLESGTYHVEIVAPGYEPLEFDVRITPGQKVTYRGDLRLERF